MRLIDADKLYSKVKTEANPYGKPTLEFQSGCLVLDIIDKQPTISAVPVVRGEWIDSPTGDYPFARIVMLSGMSLIMTHTDSGIVRLAAPRWRTSHAND